MQEFFKPTKFKIFFSISYIGLTAVIAYLKISLSVGEIYQPNLINGLLNILIWPKYLVIGLIGECSGWIGIQCLSTPGEIIIYSILFLVVFLLFVYCLGSILEKLIKK